MLWTTIVLVMWGAAVDWRHSKCCVIWYVWYAVPVFVTAGGVYFPCWLKTAANSHKLFNGLIHRGQVFVYFVENWSVFSRHCDGVVTMRGARTSVISSLAHACSCGSYVLPSFLRHCSDSHRSCQRRKCHGTRRSSPKRYRVWQISLGELNHDAMYEW